MCTTLALILRAHEAQNRHMNRCRPDAAGLWGVQEPDQARQVEAALRDGPDLAGMAIMGAAPPAVAAAEGPAAGLAAPDDNMLLLRLGFLGDVAMDSISMPWAVGKRQWQHAAVADVRVAEATALVPSLGSLLGPRHSGRVPQYVIRRPAEEVRPTTNMNCIP